MPMISKVKSEHYSLMFPDHMMLKHFGETRPSVIQRADKFQKFWDSWSDNQIIMPMEITQLRVHKILQPHMKSLFEWQIRAGMTEALGPGQNITKHMSTDARNHKYMKKALFVRFCDPDLHALARILLS